MANENARIAKQKAAERRRLKDLEHKAELSRQAFEAAKAEAQTDVVTNPAVEATGQNWLAPDVKALQPVEQKHGDGWGTPDPYDPYYAATAVAPAPPYGGATSLADVQGYLDAQGKADEMDEWVDVYGDVLANIMASETITDKGGAIAAAAKELQKILGGMKQLAEMPPAAPPATPAVAAPAVPTTDAADKSLFQKFLSWIKAGARHSASDQQHINDAHDSLVAAGAACGMKLLKAADGSYRWVGWVSNKWRDVDTAKHPAGEIITEAAHKEFVGWLDAHPDQAPQWWTWHTPVRKSRADWWDYADGFLLMSGPVPDGEEKGYLELDEPVAMSHGFMVLARNGAQGLIEKYRSFEVSDLPLEVAANPWTAFDVVRKELGTMGFTPDKRAYFVKVFGEDRTKQLEAETEAMGKSLDEAGIEAKDKATPAAAAAPAAEGEVPAHILEQVKTLLNTDGLQAALVELGKQNKALADQVAALKKSDDAKIAEKIAPKVKPLQWGYQASAATDNELTDAQKEALKVGQSESWVKDAFADLVH